MVIKEIELLIEIGDTKLELPWQNNGRFLLTSFTYKKDEYVLQIENISLTHISKDLKAKKTALLSFYIKGSDTPYSTITNDNRASLKIYSIIMNAFLKKITEYYAVGLVIDRTHSKTDKEFNIKKNIYSRFADSFKYEFNGFVYDVNINNHQGFLLSKEQLTLNEHLDCIPLRMLQEGIVPCIDMETGKRIR